MVVLKNKAKHPGIILYDPFISHKHCSFPHCVLNHAVVSSPLAIIADSLRASIMMNTSSGSHYSQIMYIVAIEASLLLNVRKKVKVVLVLD